jgi:hypothetical protein
MVILDSLHASREVGDVRAFRAQGSGPGVVPKGACRCQSIQPFVRCVWDETVR